MYSKVGLNKIGYKVGLSLIIRYGGGRPPMLNLFMPVTTVYTATQKNKKKENLSTKNSKRVRFCRLRLRQCVFLWNQVRKREFVKFEGGNRLVFRVKESDRFTKVIYLSVCVIINYQIYILFDSNANLINSFFWFVKLGDLTVLVIQTNWTMVGMVYIWWKTLLFLVTQAIIRSYNNN